MRILIFTQHFPPETVATGRRACDLAESLTLRGHSVVVITGIPNHPSSLNLTFCRQAAREEFHPAGYRVVRVPVYRSSKNRIAHRLLTYASFFFFAAWKGIREDRPDAILAVSPLPTGLAALQAHWWHGTPLAFDLQDIWPDSAVAVGLMRPSLPLRVLRIIETFFYRRCALIIGITDGFRKYLIDQGVPPERVGVVPNGVQWELFTDIGPEKDFKQGNGLTDRFLIGYVGNLGLAQGLDTMIDAAEQLRDEPVTFLLVGEGTDKRRLQDSVRIRSLANVLFLDGMPRAKVLPILQACDALLLILRKDPLFEITIPSKLYEYMASGKPIICSVGGEAAEVVATCGCGLTVAPSQPMELGKAIRRLRLDPEMRSQFGKAGARCARTAFSRDILMDEYAKLLEGAILN